MLYVIVAFFTEQRHCRITFVEAGVNFDIDFSMHETLVGRHCSNV